ncbi:insertion sequence protein, partial [Sphingomonas sp. LH128]
RRQVEIDRVAPLVDCPVQVGPLAPHLDVGFIQAPARIKATPPEPAQPLLHLRGVALDPAIDRRMVDRNAAFRQHFLKVAIADRIATIPAHRPQDHITLEMAPLEIRHRSVRPISAKHAQASRFLQQSRSMDPHKPNWPVERLMSVALEQSALPAFTRALEDNRTLCLVSNQVQVEIAVPKADRWSQTTICLEKVGNQLLTASPKNANGSTANVSRDVPLPRGSGKEWFSVNNYPARARAANIQGDVSVAVSVDKYGYPVGCSVVESSNNKDLDEGACSRLVAVARFFPALEKDGRAVNGVWKTVIRWRL